LYRTVLYDNTAIGIILYKLLIDKGLTAFVGKVNMDRNCIPELTEDTETSIRETEELVKEFIGQPKVRPILTPRFVPACSPALLKKLGELAAKYNVPVQSHLSENRDEVKFVKELHPGIRTYSDVYNKYGLFGQTETLMAHCIYLEDEEIDLIRDNGVIAVYCPDSNLNLTSGVMHARKLIKRGVKVGLGSDVGGGHNISMTKAIVSAIQSSKVIRLNEPETDALTFEETFYMATKGNGCFFGKVGSFEPGYDFDALVIDDTSLGGREFDLAERLQRFIYIGDDRNIIFRYVKGNLIV
jgi:guanine deaminase